MQINEIRKLALNTELSLNYTLKDLEISKIFKILENQIKNIVLKGGTGINRVYLQKENRRFSEDIDFDIYSSKNINEIKEELYEKLKLLLKEYILEKPRIMNETIMFDVYFTWIQKDRIKLEFKINTKRIDSKKTNLKIVDYGFVPHTTSLFLIYSLEELINQKLLAFINRTEGKDIYDLYYLLQLDYDKKQIQKKLITESKQKIKKLLSDKKQIKYLENSLNHFVPKSKRHSFFALLNEIQNLLF